MTRLVMIFAAILVFVPCRVAAGQLPTAVDFGDSVTLGYAGLARYFLYGTVDFRPNPWDKENMVPRNDWRYFVPEVEKARNCGNSSTLLPCMKAVLHPGLHYDVLLFNSGLHDVQVDNTGKPRIPLGQYRVNLEAAANIARQYATAVLWVDTTVVPPNLGPASGEVGTPANSQVPYNAVARQIAKEHGFYMLTLDSKGQLPQNVHFTLDGYRYLGLQVATCVLVILAHGQTPVCHQ
jgi:hypothetical protein